jgi:hypothetical protein
VASASVSVLLKISSVTTAGGTVNSLPARFEELERRLLSLEKQNRRLKRLGAAALIVVTLLVVMGQAPSKKTIVANQFILADDNGKPRATLWMNTNNRVPELLFFNEQERVAAKLQPSSLALFDAQGPIRGLFSVNNTGGSLLLIDSERPLKQVFLQPGSVAMIDDRGSQATVEAGHLKVYDREGFAATLGTEALVTPHTGETHKTSAASLVMFDKNKNVLWRAP